MKKSLLKKTAERQGTVLCLLNLPFEKETENRPLSPCLLKMDNNDDFT